MALFGVHITNEVIENEDKLAEAIYKFLKIFVPKRIRYESTLEQEDCIQDTTMHLLKRFRELDRNELPDDFNYEKFFYNRANSYISYWLRRLVNDRKNIKEYMEYMYYFTDTHEIKHDNTIDIPLLKSVIAEYNLPKEDALNLLHLVIHKLVVLGYISNTQVQIANHNQTLDSLSFAVVDEYLINKAMIKEAA